ncbi:MAG: response regulator [Eubacteriales bacterium]|nr:response regulator [Eubacteriales bacterium]
MNLLIVDDEVVAMKGMLNGVRWKECGIDGTIWTAYSAQKALQILNVQQVDIMLCDIEMPGFNGLELLEVVRKSNREMPCIFLTCHASFEFAQEAIRLGCKDYILKPAPYELIEEKLKKVCEELNETRRVKEQARYFSGEKEEETTETERRNWSPGEIVEQVESYILAHLKDSDLLVTDIADKLHLNKDYLNRVFKKAHGISISQYLIQERMKLAGILLEDEKNSVNLVAEKVGYNNYPYFASSFKRYYGCTPSQYQKEKGKHEL